MPPADLKELLRAGDTLLTALLERAETDDELRDALRSLGGWLTARLDSIDERIRRQRRREQELRPPVAVDLEIGGTKRTVFVPRTPEAMAMREPAGVTVGPGSEREAAVARREFSPVEGPAHIEPDLAVVAARARLKATGCWWASRRRQLTEGGADHDTAIKPRDHDLGHKARALPHCFLWMLDPYCHLPDDETLQRTAECYENIALAAEIARDGTADRAVRPPESLLGLVAEAQSALRSSLVAAEVDGDRDQIEVFEWLRDQTRRHAVFLKRFMRLDDPADPAESANLRRRLEEYTDDRARQDKFARKRRGLRNRLRYHLEQLGRDPDHDPNHLLRVVDTLRDWVREGLAPSDPTLCEILARYVDELPVQTDAAEVEIVLRSVDEYISTREARRRPARTEPRRDRDPDLVRVGELLRDKVVVLIGGHVRRESKANLERDLSLAELRWIETRSHQPVESFEPDIAHPEVALVLRVVRWTSHVHADLREVCVKHGKPFVNLPAGYGSSQVARQILAQVSEQLTAGRP